MGSVLRAEDIAEVEATEGAKVYDVALHAEVVRKDFPIFETQAHGKPLVYLDSAATSQKPRQVIDRMVRFYETENANVHRGLYELGEKATVAYEGAREACARFIGARSPRSIVFTRGTTESINLIRFTWAKENVHEGDEILVTEMEHHSNLIPWQLFVRRDGRGSSAPADRRRRSSPDGSPRGVHHRQDEARRA